VASFYVHANESSGATSVGEIAGYLNDLIFKVILKKRLPLLIFLPQRTSLRFTPVVWSLHSHGCTIRHLSRSRLLASNC